MFRRKGYIPLDWFWQNQWKTHKLKETYYNLKLLRKRGELPKHANGLIHLLKDMIDHPSNPEDKAEKANLLIRNLMVGEMMLEDKLKEMEAPAGLEKKSNVLSFAKKAVATGLVIASLGLYHPHKAHADELSATINNKGEVGVVLVGKDGLGVDDKGTFYDFEGNVGIDKDGNFVYSDREGQRRSAHKESYESLILKNPQKAIDLAGQELAQGHLKEAEGMYNTLLTYKTNLNNEQLNLINIGLSNIIKIRTKFPEKYK